MHREIIESGRIDSVKQMNLVPYSVHCTHARTLPDPQQATNMRTGRPRGERTEEEPQHLRSTTYMMRRGGLFTTADWARVSAKVMA